MYVVTGGAGFIGSNLVEGLNRSGENDILVVDEFSDVSQVRNLAGCRIADYQDKEDFLMSIERSGLPSSTSAVFHMGACSNTMAEDGRYVMKTNFDYSKRLLHACVDSNVPLIYASSAAVYGRGTSFAESEHYEYPLNAYAFSKQLFDSYVRKEADRISSQVVALRYFNVYGPRETHKASMASIVYQMFKQYSKHGRLRLFRGTGGYGDGEQRRDFISVDDIVSVNLFFLENPELSGIFNVGTGRSRSFNDVGLAVINTIRATLRESPITLKDSVADGLIEYFDIPDTLKSRYQSFTEADITRLCNAGFSSGFHSLEEGVSAYHSWLKEDQPFEISTDSFSANR